MIRLFIVSGTALIAIASYLTVYETTEFQLPPKSSQLVKFQSEGMSPAPDAVSENEEVEHGIFEVPPEDERQLEMAMGGMNMGGMNMAEDGNANGSMVMEGDDKTAMKMADDNAPKMKLNPDGTMMTNADGSMVMEGDDKTAMKMEGGMAEEAMSASGLAITEDGEFDREINLTMEEWKFSDLNIEVKAGERIRFTVKNGGQIPHEFMFMTMPAMAAVTYRAKRADWNLLEHEALFEKSLVLPGGSFTFVANIEKDGSWMFMCMLPYHMQMGMMGQIATPGNAMDMNMSM